MHTHSCVFVLPSYVSHAACHAPRSDSQPAFHSVRLSRRSGRSTRLRPATPMSCPSRAQAAQPSRAAPSQPLILAALLALWLATLTHLLQFGPHRRFALLPPPICPAAAPVPHESTSSRPERGGGVEDQARETHRAAGVRDYMAST
jgi:hypothetical protein